LSCPVDGRGVSHRSPLLYLLRRGSRSLLVAAVYIHIRCCIPNGVHFHASLLHGRIGFFFVSFTPLLVTSLLLHDGNGIWRDLSSLAFFLSFFLFSFHFIYSLAATMIVCVHLRSLFYFFSTAVRSEFNVFFFSHDCTHSASLCVSSPSAACMYVCVPTVEYTSCINGPPTCIPKKRKQLEAEDEEEAKHAHTHARSSCIST